MTLLNRRILLGAGAAGGAAAWIGLSERSHGRGPGRPRLAVFMLDGGMDGLSLAPPLKDGRYHDLRRTLAVAEPLPFTADFGMHPALPKLSAMARAGEVRLAPAAAAPTRTRSHTFEAQALASGLADGHPAAGGWLNRAVAALSPSGALPAVSLNAIAATAVAGPALFGSWAPGAAAPPRGLADDLHQLYREDPHLLGLAKAADLTRRRAEAVLQGDPLPDFALRARTLGRLFEGSDGPSVGYLAHGGFDTHQNQGAAQGRLADRFRELDEALSAFREGCGAAWPRTLAVVCTEFGRTAAANGAGGTDHGVASAALLIGGAVRKGGLLGDWPGLAESALYEGRDLAPALPLHGLFKGVLAEHMGLSRRALDTVVFPDSAGVAPLGALTA